MLELKTKKELAQFAHVLAGGHGLVRYKHTTYMPVDVNTGEPNSIYGEPDTTMWIPLSREAIRLLAANQFDALFSSDAELSSFEFMVAQNGIPCTQTQNNLLIRTNDGLKELREDGKLYEPLGQFIPNTLDPVLVASEEVKARVFGVISEWLDSDQEAHSLLHHLATTLAPGWSAVKYVLLLGEGRNGKSLLLKMVQAVFGWTNCSNVTRQQMAEQSPVVTELNGKLVNIVFDGRSEYVRDSGTEKSLIAGELVPIRKLYETTPTPVQTNALFIEGLNREPKSTDKSVALQKRLIRFGFPNVYQLDHLFEKEMLSEESLGAFLSLLIDHYVEEHEVSTKLAPTTKAVELQLEHMYINSLGLQFLKHMEESETFQAESLLGISVDELAQLFQSWRIAENDMGGWAVPDVQALFQPLLNYERKSKRIDGKPRKIRLVVGFKPEALAFLETLKGEDE